MFNYVKYLIYLSAKLIKNVISAKKKQKIKQIYIEKKRSRLKIILPAPNVRNIGVYTIYNMSIYKKKRIENYPLALQVGLEPTTP